MDNLVEALVQADQVYERAMELHRAAHSAVRRELRVGALVTVGVESGGFVHVIVVRRGTAETRRRRDDGQSGIGLSRFPDSLPRRRETDALALKLEALGELGRGGDISIVSVAESTKTREGGKTESPVSVEIRRRG